MVSVTAQLEGNTLLVRLNGDFDMAVADNVRYRLDDYLDDGKAKNIVMDLKDVNFIDSSGLGVILGRYKKISMLGGKMAITRAQPQVERILELSGIQKIINCYQSEEDALQAM